MTVRRKELSLDFALKCSVSKHDVYSEKGRINIDKWVRSNKAAPGIAEVVWFPDCNEVREWHGRTYVHY